MNDKQKAVTFQPTNSAGVFRHNSRGPISFEKLLPGSLFRIVQRRNGGLQFSAKLYIKSDRGYYATPVDSQEGVVLYPEELVMPIANKAVRA